MVPYVYFTYFFRCPVVKVAYFIGYIKTGALKAVILFNLSKSTRDKIEFN